MSDIQAKWMTVAFIAMVIAITILYDVIVYHFCGPHATISRVCGEAMDRYPVMILWVTFGLGILLGHFHLSAW